MLDKTSEIYHILKMLLFLHKKKYKWTAEVDKSVRIKF